MLKKTLGVILLLLESFVYYWLYNTMHLNPPMLQTGLGLYIVYLLIFRHYRITDTLVWDDIKRLILATFLYMVTYAIIMPSTAYNGVPRRLMCLLALMMFFVDLILSTLLRRLFRSRLSKKTLIIGAGDTAFRYEQITEQNKHVITETVGFINLNGEAPFEQEYPVCDELYYNKDKYHVFDYRDFDNIVKENRIDQIVICEPNLTKQDLHSVIDRSIDLVKSVKYVPEDFDLVNFSSEIQDLDGILLISTTKDEPGFFDHFIKRIIDIIVGIIGCILNIPAMIIISIANRAHGDHGSLFFKQKRLGKNGKEITIYKYRTMNNQQDIEDIIEKNPAYKEEYRRSHYLKYDPRLTAVGRFLRKTTIDNMPQFLNVLKGDMSFIGPQPYLPSEKDDMGKYYTTIMKSKPGMLGMWQTNRRKLSFDDRCMLDFYYYKNWNFWLDFVIFFKSLGVILRGKA